LLRLQKAKQLGAALVPPFVLIMRRHSRENSIAFYNLLACSVISTDEIMERSRKIGKLAGD
jgi:hypothetical protein